MSEVKYPGMVRKVSHYFEFLDSEGMRPQDTRMDGSGLTFKTSEHGGNVCDLFPNVITVTDEQGRWCKYVPITEQGRDVRSYGYFTADVNLDESRKRDRCEMMQKHSESISPPKKD
jgi:hypothetical protein